MKFTVDLGGTPHATTSAPSYSEEDDDVRSIISDVCDAVRDAGSGTFEIELGSGLRLPLEVPMDLPEFLEQLPLAIGQIAGNKAAEIHMYEQGIEAMMRFVPHGPQTAVSWQPYGGTTEPLSVSVETEDLLVQLRAARDEFLRAVERYDPKLRTHPWVQAWASEVTGV